MRRGLGILLLVTAAWATPEDEIDITLMLQEPASLPGKLNFGAYSKVLAAKGYAKSRLSADDIRSEVAEYFGRMLSARCVVRRIRVAEGGASATAAVDLGGWKLRFFLVKEGGRWWYSDFEVVKRALRLSDWDYMPDWLREACDTDDEAKAVKLLLPAPEGKRPATLEVARLARLAYCLWMVDREAEALHCCDEASALCDAPVIELYRAFAAFGADDLELAVKAANAYLDAVGEDPQGCYELGRALYWLHRRPEAVAAHLRGLKANPSDADNILGLFRALPDDGKAPAVEHFLKMAPLSEWFAYLAAQLVAKEEWASVEALVVAYKKDHASDPAVAKWEAVALAGRGRYAEAAPLFLSLLPKCDKDRSYVAKLYLTSMHELGKPLEGYAQLPPEDRDRTWSYLASRLSYAKDAASLDGLLAKRRDHPDESLAIWEIELRWLRKQYAEVDSLFRKHLDEIRRSEDSESWRPADLEARSLLRLGKAAEALAPASERDNPIVLFAVYATLGRKEEATQTLEGALARKGKLSYFEDDEDAGPILKSDAFADLRAKHAEKGK